MLCLLPEDIAEDVEQKGKNASWHRYHPHLYRLIGYEACADKDYHGDEHQRAVEDGAYPIPDLGPWILSQRRECLWDAFPKHGQQYKVIECCWDQGWKDCPLSEAGKEVETKAASDQNVCRIRGHEDSGGSVGSHELAENPCRWLETRVVCEVCEELNDIS